MFLTAHCLNVEFAGTQHHMQIDLASVEALELIKPLAAGCSSKKGNSLYRCFTQPCSASHEGHCGTSSCWIHVLCDLSTCI